MVSPQEMRAVIQGAARSRQARSMRR
jgi:hypothetical protein